MKTPAEWKALLRKRQGYADNTKWVMVWVEDIKEIWQDGFEAGKQSVQTNENAKSQNHRVSGQET